jgi:hypothetical protein
LGLEPSRKVFEEKYDWKKLGGSADGGQNKGVAKIATQKLLKPMELQIDHFRDAVRVGEVRRGETGTLSGGP